MKYEFFKSARKNKKYKVVIYKKDKKIKTIHFGGIKKDGTPYPQFKDSTPLKLYSKYDTNDKERKKLYSKYDTNDNERRTLYYKRHKKDYGKLSADYFSKKYLW